MLWRQPHNRNEYQIVCDFSLFTTSSWKFSYRRETLTTLICQQMGVSAEHTKFSPTSWHVFKVTGNRSVASLARTLPCINIERLKGCEIV